MFHTHANASKVCLAYLVEASIKFGISMIDCQVHTPHLENMGAEEITRTEYLGLLKTSLKSRLSVVDWAVL
jgi:leucyl/phenylalanyl-tRNA--protein transferase